MSVSFPAEKSKTLPEFRWEEPEERLMRTPLYETHKNLGAKLIPFAGWEMPVWYTSVMEEHLATRQAAGLFDVAHMGVYQCEGPDAASISGLRLWQRHQRFGRGRILLHASPESKS